MRPQPAQRSEQERGSALAKRTLDHYRDRKISEGMGFFPMPFASRAIPRRWAPKGRDFDFASLLANVTLEQCVVSYT